MNEFILGLPIYLALAFSIIIIIIATFTKNKSTFLHYFTLVAMLTLLCASFYTLFIPQSTINSFNVENSFSKGMLVFGGLPSIFDIIFIVAGILTVLASLPYLQKEYETYKEFYALLLFSLFGVMIIAHSNNLIMLFIGIELMSLSFYILAGFFRNRISSVEAAMKYFLLGSFATGFLLYGMAMIYGGSQALYFNDIFNNIVAGSINYTYMKIGIALLIVGLSFKIAAFPFHLWAPDVYQGSPTIVTGFMSTAGKAGAIVAFIILGRFFFPILAPDLLTESAIKTKEFIQNAQLIIAIISTVTMLLGNILALIQKNIKRMLAYSSIAHAGYLLIGIVSNNADGWNGIIFYSMSYMFMQIGAFIIVSILEKNDNFLNLEDYSGLIKTHPFLASVMAAFMFSLAGIPPFAGFVGKYVLFLSAIETGYTWLTIIGVISSIISMYFYIGLIIYMFFKEPINSLSESKFNSAYISVAISLFFIIFLGVFPGLLLDFTKTFFNF